MRLCMASARIFKMHTHESRSERALRSHGLESGFLGGSRSKTPFFSRSKTHFRSLILNSFASTWAKIRLQIRKGPNHVPKRLSERDSSSCEHSLVLLSIAMNGPSELLCKLEIHCDNNTMYIIPGGPKRTEQSIF